MKSENIRLSGFTLIELLVVVSIIVVLISTILVLLGDARVKGRDGARKSQIYEVIKALDLYYTDNDEYPTINGSVGTGGNLDDIEAAFFGVGTYLKKLPKDAGTRYYYCVSSDRSSVLIAVNTEQDKGGSEFCSVMRGPGPDYGCTVWQTTNASDSCSSRF